MLKRERSNPFEFDLIMEEDHFKQEYESTKSDSQTVSSDTDSFLSEVEISNTELGLSEDHFSRPDGAFGLSSSEELQLAIENCKQMYIECDSMLVDRRKAIVKKLVKLRLKLQELEDTPAEAEQMPLDAIRSVMGHKFRKRRSKSAQFSCDRCTSLIWGMLQTWYTCKLCSFNSHEKCLNLVLRYCVAAQLQQADTPYIMRICPEKGLVFQSFRCAECRIPIDWSGTGESSPRQCDYNGLFYCDRCHWNDLRVIPARVILNWDWTPMKVCRASVEALQLLCTRPIINIEQLNPRLFSFLDELADVKRLRGEILLMKKYFLTCKNALESKILLKLSHRQHFVDNADFYAMNDLVDLINDILLPDITRIHAAFAQHIKTDCRLCQCKGYICEICESPEILFPFDNIAVVCQLCSSVLHRYCLLQRNGACPKCNRIKERQSSIISQQLETI